MSQKNHIGFYSRPVQEQDFERIRRLLLANGYTLRRTIPEDGRDAHPSTGRRGWQKR